MENSLISVHLVSRLRRGQAQVLNMGSSYHPSRTVSDEYEKYRDFIEIVSPDLVIVMSSAHARVFSDASGLCGVQ